MKILAYKGLKKAKEQCGSYAKAYPEIADNLYHYFACINADGHEIEVGFPFKAVEGKSYETAKQAVEALA